MAGLEMPPPDFGRGAFSVLADTILTMAITKPTVGASGWNTATDAAIDQLNLLENDPFNVKTYGATGNGTTADHVAIQNAINAANTAGGGTVYFPRGTYIINKYIQIPGSNIHLRGAGMFASTLKCGTTFTGGGTVPLGGGYSMLCVAATGYSNLSVADMSFDGNESANRATLSASGVRVNSYLVDMRSVTGLRLERISTRNSWTYNIVVWECSRFVVAGCDVQDPGTTGVYDQLDGIHVLGSNQGRVIHNRVDNAIGGDADDALVCHVIDGSLAAYDIVYANNVCRGGTNGNGIQVAGDNALIRDIVIANNVFWGCRSGITTNWFGSTNQPIRSITITGNTVRDCTTNNAIWVHYAGASKWEDITISNNVVDGFGNATDPGSYGICAEGGGGSRGLVITGNVVRNGYARAIALVEGTAVQDYIISDNIIDCSTATDFPIAIILGHSKDGIVSNNVITGKGTTDGIAIYLVSTAAQTATSQSIIGNRIRNWQTGTQVSTDSGTNMPTKTLYALNNPLNCGTATSFATATVLQTTNVT